MTVHKKDGYDNNDILCYFCFPCLGFAIPLRVGNVLFFNPNQPHCVSSRFSNDDEIYCLSLYLKYQNVSQHNNSMLLTEEMNNILMAETNAKYTK